MGKLAQSRILTYTTLHVHYLLFILFYVFLGGGTFIIQLIKGDSQYFYIITKKNLYFK